MTALMQQLHTAPVVKPAITIAPTPAERRLNAMIQLVKGGAWRRNYIADEFGRHCALGLIQRVCRWL